jgi:hypothetical protein
MKTSLMADSEGNVDPAEAVPLGDLLAEGHSIVGTAADQGLTVRMLGGAAIHFLTREEVDPVFRRVPQDIDFVCRKGHARSLGDFMINRGYRADEMFNAVNGHRRMLFYDDQNGRQVDIFVGEFSMCHVIPIEDRLEFEEITLPRVELLLMKLQIFELNAKDQRDILHLLLYSELSTEDSDAINVGYIADLCARDWGLWRTVTLNLERTRYAVEKLDLDRRQGAMILKRVDVIERALDEAPKTRRWRLRARVGDRVQWYEQPEEVQ